MRDFMHLHEAFVSFMFRLFLVMCRDDIVMGATVPDGQAELPTCIATAASARAPTITLHRSMSVR